MHINNVIAQTFPPKTYSSRRKKKKKKHGRMKKKNRRIVSVTCTLAITHEKEGDSLRLLNEFI